MCISTSHRSARYFQKYTASKSLSHFNRLLATDSILPVDITKMIENNNNLIQINDYTSLRIVWPIRFKVVIHWYHKFTTKFFNCDQYIQ